MEEQDLGHFAETTGLCVVALPIKVVRAAVRFASPVRVLVNTMSIALLKHGVEVNAFSSLRKRA